MSPKMKFCKIDCLYEYLNNVKIFLQILSRSVFLRLFWGRQNSKLSAAKGVFQQKGIVSDTDVSDM